MKTKTIQCAFCRGTGSHPDFNATCPVCKGKGKNSIRGVYITCQDCNGSGRKLGTTLTCYSCGGIGQVADRRAIVAQAAREIRQARAEMEKERAELRGRTEAPARRGKASKQESNSPSGYFCQNCGEEKHQEAFKICQGCLSALKDKVLKEQTA